MRGALILLAVLPLALAACGDTVSLDPVAKAAEKTRSVSSARFTLDANVAESGGALTVQRTMETALLL